MAAASDITSKPTSNISLSLRSVDVHECISSFLDHESIAHLSTASRALWASLRVIYWYRRPPIPQGVYCLGGSSTQTLRIGPCVVITSRLNAPGAYTVHKVMDLRTSKNWPTNIPGLAIGSTGCFLGDASRFAIIKLHLDDSSTPHARFTGSATCFSWDLDGFRPSCEISLPRSFNLDPSHMDLGTFANSWVTDGSRVFVKQAGGTVGTLCLGGSTFRSSATVRADSIRCGDGFLVVNHSREGGSSRQAVVYAHPSSRDGITPDRPTATAAAAAPAPLEGGAALTVHAVIEGTVLSPVSHHCCLVERNGRRYLITLGDRPSEIRVTDRGAVCWNDAFFICAGNDRYCIGNDRHRIASTYLQLFTRKGEFVKRIPLPEKFHGRVISQLEIVGREILMHTRIPGGEDFCVLTFPVTVETTEEVAPAKKQ